MRKRYADREVCLHHTNLCIFNGCLFIPHLEIMSSVHYIHRDMKTRFNHRSNTFYYEDVVNVIDFLGKVIH